MSLKKNTKPHKKMTSLDSSGKRELVVNKMGQIRRAYLFFKYYVFEVSIISRERKLFMKV